MPNIKETSGENDGQLNKVNFVVSIYIDYVDHVAELSFEHCLVHLHVVYHFQLQSIILILSHSIFFFLWIYFLIY